jgi:hypothetical protein
MASEDWRIHVVLEADGGRGPWSEDRLEANSLAEDVGEALGDRVAVSRDDAELFLYADTEEAARAAEEVVRADVEQHGWRAEVTLARWHDDAEEWMSPDVALPASDAERAAEHAALVAEEDSEPTQWEVRVDLPTHRDAKRLAESLEASGVKPVRRWKYLFVGAPDEDEAAAWAERLKAEAAPGSKVTVEATFQSVEKNNPFAIFGAGGGVT